MNESNKRIVIVKGTERTDSRKIIVLPIPIMHTERLAEQQMVSYLVLTQRVLLQEILVASTHLETDRQTGRETNRQTQTSRKNRDRETDRPSVSVFPPKNVLVRYHTSIYLMEVFFLSLREFSTLLMHNNCKKIITKIICIYMFF